MRLRYTVLFQVSARTQNKVMAIKWIINIGTSCPLQNSSTLPWSMPCTWWTTGVAPISTNAALHAGSKVVRCRSADLPVAWCRPQRAPSYPAASTRWWQNSGSRNPRGGQRAQNFGTLQRGNHFLPPWVRWRLSRARCSRSWDRKEPHRPVVRSMIMTFKILNQVHSLS